MYTHSDLLFCFLLIHRLVVLLVCQFISMLFCLTVSIEAIGWLFVSTWFVVGFLVRQSVWLICLHVYLLVQKLWSVSIWPFMCLSTYLSVHRLGVLLACLYMKLLHMCDTLQFLSCLFLWLNDLFDIFAVGLDTWWVHRLLMLSIHGSMHSG